MCGSEPSKMKLLVNRCNCSSWVNLTWIIDFRHFKRDLGKSYLPFWPFLAKFDQNRLLKVLVQGGQNRDLRPSQNINCWCLLELKFCVLTSMKTKRWRVSFELLSIFCRRNWGVAKSRFCSISLFGQISVILRKLHLELFPASKHALTCLNVLAASNLTPNTSLGNFRKNRLSSKIKVPVHLFETQKWPKWRIWKTRFGQKWAIKLPFELKIFSVGRIVPL